ncbi:MAG: AMP-binding protein [Candidatus Hodarchaeales archaeon]
MTSRFWTKSYDEGIKDLDPAVWEVSFAQAIRKTFEKVPDKMALSFLGVPLTYRDLDRYSNIFGHMLIEKGFQKGDCIGLNLPNIPQYIIALLGAMKVGCVITGISPLLSEDQMLYQLNDAEAKGIVTLDAVFAARLVNIADKLPNLQLIVTTSVGDFLPKVKAFLGKLIGKIPKGKVTPIEGKTICDFMSILKTAEYSSELPDVSITPDDLLFLLYTGGTTGAPKGAMLTNRNVAADMLITQSWLNWEHGRGVALSGFPFFHIAGIFFCINCIYLGWSQVLIPNPRDTDAICKGIENYKPTVLVNVPSLFQMLLANPKFKTLDHSQTEYCISAAAPFPVESQKELESIVGEGKLLEVYGMTETSPLTTMNPSRGKKKLGSIGLPLINTDIILVDPATGKEVPIGESGEICVKGPQVMEGYWNKPEETQQAINENGYMHTGDVGVFDEEGYLKIVDRTKDMIIVGGYKVFSSKLEDILVQHPAINMIATIGVPNPDRPGSEFVKAYITLPPDYAYDGDEAALQEEIIAWAKTKCSPYEIPKFIEFREELPLTLVGKVNKRILRQKTK